MIKKVIFYDGNLSDLPIEFLTKYLFMHAGRGYTLNQEKLAEMNNKASKFSIITNDLLVWGNDTAWWNDKENKCHAYILKEVNGKWKEVNIQDLTEKELRKPHDNIFPFFYNGKRRSRSPEVVRSTATTYYRFYDCFCPIVKCRFSNLFNFPIVMTYSNLLLYINCCNNYIFLLLL